MNIRPHDPKMYDAVIEQIVDYALDEERFSSSAYSIASICLMDTLGCGVEALKSPNCMSLLGPTVPGLELEKGTRVPGTNYKLDPVTAAFNIGVMNRWLEFNDTWLAAEWAHPSDNLGAILGVADWLSRERVDQGGDAITLFQILDCMVRAYEIQGVLCLENAFNKLGIDHVIFVKIASTAIACRLLGLNKEKTAAAVSNAFIDGHPLRVYRHAPNAGTRKSWAAGDATSRGVKLALIARRGEMGYKQALTTPKWGFYDATFSGKEISIPLPFREMVMENILFKVPFPAEYHAQTAVEAAIKAHNILKKMGGNYDDISSITIRTQRPAIDIIDKQGPLTNPADRDHCMQYMVAVALITGGLKPEDYEDSFASDERIDSLRVRIQCEEEPSFTEAYYTPSKRAIANTLKITLKDGSNIEDITIEYPIGHKVRRGEAIPLLIEKFKSNMQSMYSESHTDELISAFLNVEYLSKLSVTEFMDLFENVNFKRPSNKGADQ